MCYIICSDSDVVLFEDRKQLRIITDNTGGNNLGSLPVTDRKFSQLCVQLVQLCSVFRLLHEVECLQNCGTFGWCDNITVLVSQFYELTASCTALVVYNDSILDVRISNLSSSDLFQISFYMVVLIDTELKTKLFETVLRMS